MNFAHICWLVRWGQRTVAALAVALLLAVATQSVAAQGPPPNLDFNDGSSTRYNSTGRAFVGAVSGNIYGSMRNGVVRSLDVRLDPDVNGPKGLRLLLIDYNANPSIIPPRVQWYVSGATRRLVITNVPARQYFSGTGVYSRGYAKVEITFDGGAGKAVVSYTHSVYTHTKPSAIEAYNGTVFSGTPLAGRRLNFTLK